MIGWHFVQFILQTGWWGAQSLAFMFAFIFPLLSCKKKNSLSSTFIYCCRPWISMGGIDIASFSVQPSLRVYMWATRTGQEADKKPFEVILYCPWKSPLLVTLHILLRCVSFFCSFVHFPSSCLLQPSCFSELIPLCIFVCFSVSVKHCSTGIRIQFLIGPPGFHSSSLLIFSCFPFCTPRGWNVSIGPGQWRRVWVIEKQIEDEGMRKDSRERKMKRDNVEKRGRIGRRGSVVTEGPCWPLTLIMTLKVTPEVRGCVKVPLRQFTPLLCDDDLMQPPQPVWHDQCCSLPAAPKGHTSIANPATRGPLKAPYRQSQWAGGKGTQTEKSGKAKGQRGCFILYPVAPWRG